MLQLARGDGASAADPPPTDLLAVDNRIASGIFSVQDWWVLEQMSAPSGG